MASIVSAGTTSATALNMSADTTGVLQLASNNGTVALTVDTSQNVSIGVSSGVNKLTIAQAKTGAGAETYNLLRLYLTGTRTLNDTIGIRFGGTGSSVDTGAITCISGADDALYGTLTFSTRRYTTDTLDEAMRIDNRGIIYAGGSTNATANGTIYSKTTARAWCFYNGVTQSISGSFNISSVTYNAAGDYTFNLTTAVSSATGALLASKSNQITNSANAQGISWTGTSTFGLVNYEANNKVNSPVYVVAFA
jgi:hypothetical protein